MTPSVQKTFFFGTERVLNSIMGAIGDSNTTFVLWKERGGGKEKKEWLDLAAAGPVRREKRRKGEGGSRG